MTILLVILVLLSGAGIIAGSRMAKTGIDLGKPLMAGCAALGLVLAFVIMWPSGNKIEQVTNITKRYNQLCGEKMGRYLAEQYPGQRVLIVVRPQNEETPLTDMEQSLLKALQDSIRNDMLKVDIHTPERPAEFQAYIDKLMSKHPDAYPQGEADFFHGMPEHDMWFKGKIFEELIKSNMYEYDIILFTFDLSFEPTKLKLFKDEEAPKLALINSEPRLMGPGLRNKIVCAAIGYQPDPKAWKNITDVPSDDAEAFLKRYILLTPDNMEEVAAKYPSYF